MQKIHIKAAKSTNHNEILNFLREEFYPFEHLTLAHSIPGVTEDDEAFTMSHLHSQNGIVLMTFADENCEKLVGVLIAGAISSKNITNENEPIKTEKWNDIFNFLIFIEKRANILQKFNIDKYLQIHAIAVKNEVRGQKIAQKLIKKCFNIAENNYEVVCMDCTSTFSIKVAENLEMQAVSEIYYEEYNKIIGEEKFAAQEPHTVIITFVKIMCNNKIEIVI